MFNIMGKKILLDKSEILYNRPFSDDSIKEDWDIATGEWRVENGWLAGKNIINGGGIIYSKNTYPGDIMLDFYGRTVPPCNHDLNFTWCSEGWDYSKNDAGISYIAGIEGWWTSKTGIEKYPECNLQAMTSLLDFKPGRIYHIQAGILQNYCFIFVDGKLAVEMRDSNPIDSKKFGKIGFGTYCSSIQIRDFKLYGLVSEDAHMEYTPPQL